MRLVYKFYIRHTEELDRLFRVSNNLYNQALYLFRQPSDCRYTCAETYRNAGCRLQCRMETKLRHGQEEQSKVCSDAFCETGRLSSI